MGNPTTHDWVRLEVLILRRACAILRKQFRRRWKLTQGKEWVDSPEFGKDFVSTLGSEIYKGCGRLHKMSLEEGDVNNWDFTMLTRILQQVNFHPDSENLGKEIESENKRIEELISYSKKAIDYPTKILGDDEFSKLWDNIEKILISFGGNEKELEELKRTESVSEDDLLSLSGEDSQHPVDDHSLQEAKRLKEEAKNFVVLGKIEDAIASLDKAISMHKVLPDLELGALYASRSDAILKKVGNLRGKEEKKELAYLALKDAKQALFLRPAWGLAYYRVGMTYVELGKYKKASKYLDQALDLEPNVEEIKVANNSCKIKMVELSDDFAPHLKTFQKVDFHSKKAKPLPGGTRPSPEIMDKIDTIFFNFETSGGNDECNVLADIYKAHKLRDGINTKQSYKDAAALYRKAVKCRNAEAMYNLALLKLDGKGTKQDVKGALDLLKRAAKQPQKLVSGYSNFASNVGVVESSYILGLLAVEGIGFPPQKDYFSAAVWYQAASDHGHGPAANNLAILYSRGLGVAKNEKRALQLWKLGASRKVPESMFGLAIHHARDWETAEARKWLELAISEYQMQNAEETSLLEEEDREENETGEGWVPTPTLVQEFTTVLNTIDHWRVRYGQKEIARWEVSSGWRQANQNLTLKSRISRMLHELDYEKEQVSEVEDYLTHLQTKAVTLPFETAKIWASHLRHEMYLGGHSEGGDSRNPSQSRSISSTGSYSDESSLDSPPPFENT